MAWGNRFDGLESAKFRRGNEIKSIQVLAEIADNLETCRCDNAVKVGYRRESEIREEKGDDSKIIEGSKLLNIYEQNEDMKERTNNTGRVRKSPPRTDGRTRV